MTSVADTTSNLDDSSATAADTDNFAGDVGSNLVVRVDTTDGFSNQSDDFSVDRFSISGDSLKLVVSYGGGCEPHDFVVWTNGSPSQDKPPTVSIVVVHDANDDTCEASIQQDLLIDLSPLKASVLKQHPEMKNGIVSIVVQGVGQPIRYRLQGT